MRDWAKRLLGYDTETTGLGDNARVIEFGAVLVEDAKVVTSWQVMLHPEGVDWNDPDVAKALEVNHITMDMLQGRRQFHEEFATIRHALQQSEVRVGHNLAFDARMLRQEFQRAVAAGLLRQDAAKPVKPLVSLDTCALDEYLNPDAEGRSLEKVAPRWGVTTWQKHRAIGDADACIRVLQAMSDLLPESLQEVAAISDRIAKKRQAWFASQGRL